MKKSLVVVAMVVGALLAPTRGWGVMLEYNFDSLNVGSNLLGQDGWSNISVTNPGATVGFGAGIYADTLVASNTSNSNDTGFKGLSWQLTGAETVTMEFDCLRTSVGGLGMFGPSAGYQPGPIFGFFYASATQPGWNIRGANFGTMSYAVNSSGTVVSPANNHWYRVRSVMDLSANNGAGLGTLEIMDLTAGATTFTKLYFNAAQTIDKVSLGLVASDNFAKNPAKWNGIYLRLKNNSGSAMADNLVVTPEPATMALLAIGGAMALRRRSK